MENLSPEKMILLASTISLEITKNNTLADVNSIKTLLNLICNNLTAYCIQEAFYKKDLSNNQKD